MKIEPKIFYGLHFCPGVAEYTNSERIYIPESTAKKMDATFPGRPVYVEHVDGHDKEPDGYVVESFFNPFDGMHWAKFIVTSEEGQRKIQDGWRLSNAYFVTGKGDGGKNHNVEYAYEVLDATYDHLAIVQAPRYEESVILNLDEFKAYNEQKKNALEQLKNSEDIEKGKENGYDIQEPKKNGVRIMFSFFKKEKIENGDEVKNLVVTLKNGQEMTVEKLVEMANKKNEDEEEEEKKKKENEEAEKAKKEEEEKKNAEDAEKKKKEEEEEENKKNEIKNAMENALKNSSEKVLHVDQVARGKSLYGSK